MIRNYKSKFQNYTKCLFKWLFLITILIIARESKIINAFSPAFSASPFADITTSHPNYKAIKYLKEKKIISGYSDGSFKAGNKINRGEFLTISLLTKFKEKNIKGENCFPDTTTVWPAKFVCFAKEKKIISGCPDGLFHPERNIKFAEAATLIGNVFNFIVRDDQDLYYRPYVEELSNKKSIPISIPALDYEITRGDAAEIIWRLITKSENEESLMYKNNSLAKEESGKSLSGKLQFGKWELEIDFSLRKSEKKPNKYFDYLDEIDLSSTYLNDPRPKGFLLEENFEKSFLGNLEKSEHISYTPGKEGFGMINQYENLEDATAPYYDNTKGKLIHPNSGTVEFWIKPLGDPNNDNETHRLFYADLFGKSFAWVIEIYKDSFLVHRDFPPCHRLTGEARHEFKKNLWYNIKITWKNKITKVFVNENEFIDNFQFVEKRIAKSTFIDLSKVYLGDNLFVLDSLKISSGTDINNEKDLEFPKNLVCKNFKKILEKYPLNETYKDINIRGFSDKESLEKIKFFLGHLTNQYLFSAKEIVLLQDEEFNNWHKSNKIKASFNYTLGQSIMLRKSLFSDENKISKNARILFHEFGHALSYKLGITYGGPEDDTKRREWADISGIESYSFEYSNWEEPKNFEIKNGILTLHSSRIPDEDLAEWVGITLDLYAKGETFSDLLRPGSKLYDEKNKRKIDFLLEKGFISQEIYDAITRTEKNTRYYLEFNE